MGIPKRALVYIILIVSLAVTLNYAAAQGGHPEIEVELPAGGGVWTGLNAEMLNGNRSIDFLSRDYWEISGGSIYYSGRVGIGTGGSPFSGNLTVQSSDPSGGILLSNNTGDSMLFSSNGTASIVTVYLSKSLILGGGYPPSEMLDVAGRVKATDFCIGNDTRSEWTWKKNGSDIYYNSGSVGIGLKEPVGILHLSDSIKSGIVLPRMNTSQRDALPAVVGTVIYNNQTDTIDFYNGMWNSLSGTPI